MIHIVLFEPEIHQNTGNIMRTCVALGATLHLIKPLGFSLEDKYLKRSALDYIEHLNMHIYENYQEFQEKNKGAIFYLTRYGKQNYAQINFKDIEEDIYLVFGKESTGIDKQILANNLDRCYRIPTTEKVRSINLANAAALVSYEVYRQKGFPGLSFVEPEIYKGKDFLDQFKDEGDNDNNN